MMNPSIMVDDDEDETNEWLSALGRKERGLHKLP